MQWNLTQERGLWIMAPDSVKQIGCIHTCKGLEVHYIGVIARPAFVVRNGTVKDSATMTRGTKGCHVYCTDEETRGWFRSRLVGI